MRDLIDTLKTSNQEKLIVTFINHKSITFKEIQFLKTKMLKLNIKMTK